MKISFKLGFIIGFLLLLTLGVGLLAYFQARFVDGKVRQIADVEHTTSVTAYQMEINVIGTSFAVLRYLHEHDSTLLNTIAYEEQEFDQFQKNFQNIVKTDQVEALGNEVKKVHASFVNLSKELIEKENFQDQKIELFQANLADLNRFLEEKIQDSIRRFDFNRYKKLKAALKMQVNANHINKNMENYLRTHVEKYKRAILQNQKEFKANLALYQDYTHSERKQQWLLLAKNKFSMALDLSKSIMDIEVVKENYLRNFEEVQKKLVVLLEQQILILAQSNLISAKGYALEASRKSLKVIAGILILGLFFGVIMAFIFARHITLPLKRLLVLTTEVAKGNFTQKALVSSDDELGLLVSSFNKMVDDLALSKKQQSELLEQLNRSNKDLDDFAYIISHDLKAPLRAIASISDWLVADYSNVLDENGKEQLGLLKERTRRMSDLIDGVLRYSRHTRRDEVKGWVEVKQLLNECLTLINKPENVNVIIDGEMPKLFIDKVRIQQVFLNLISNAIKFIDKSSGLIQVSCMQENGFYKFSVTDNGPGIEQNNFDRIFQLFQTVSPVAQKESTGIGLTIVKKIVEGYGGKVWVESKVGEGSVFYFTLPQNLF